MSHADDVNAERLTPGATVGMRLGDATAVKLRVFVTVRSGRFIGECE